MIEGVAGRQAGRRAGRQTGKQVGRQTNRWTVKATLHLLSQTAKGAPTWLVNRKCPLAQVMIGYKLL